MKSGAYLEKLLGEKEKIILITRQHWSVLASKIVLEIILILIILIAASILTIFFHFAAIIIWPVGFLLMIIPIITMTLDIAKWSNYQFIVTNRRVIQISGIFNKNVIDSNLEKVNDLKLTQSYLGRILDYGDIEILTASELGVNLFKQIAQPIKFKTALVNAKEQLEHEGFTRTDEVQQADIPSLIAHLDQLRKQGIITDQEFLSKKNELLSRL
ncbi:MAG: PH domain-containing protein [Anaerolineales bacterium]